MEKDFNGYVPYSDYNMPPFYNPNIQEQNDIYKEPFFNPIMQYEQAFSYYKFLCMQMDYKIKCKEYERLCKTNSTTSSNRVQQNGNKFTEN